MNACVIGIGTFGYNVATTLSHHGIKVLAVDSNLEAVERIQDLVTDVLCMKVIDEKSLLEANIENMDIVIIAMGDSFEETVMIAALLKRKFNIKMVVSRANNTQNKEILELIGVDYVILPEQEAGIRLADTLSAHHRAFTRVTEAYSVTSIKVAKKWIGKTIHTISSLSKNNIVVLGKRSGEVIKPIDGLYTFKTDDIIVIAGENNILEDIIEEIAP